MAAVAIAADNVRIAEAFITNDTGTWGNDGGGGGVSDEPDFFYQGSQSQSRKISTSVIGRSYTHGSGTDMTATDRLHYIAKIQATNKDALLSRTSPALHMKIGSSSSAYYTYYLFGNDNYPKRGGWQLIAIDPNVSGYRNATNGSPSLTGVLYWSLLADFSATSKSENVMIDAIDVGAGLHLTGGDGADPDGDFQDFIDADEGTAANSWGYVSTEGDAILVLGRLSIGENTSETAVATVFSDVGKVLSWRNGLVSTGFHKLRFNLGNATTDIDIDSCTFLSRGEQDNTANRGYTTTEDSRPQVEVTGTSGALTITGSQFTNFSTFDLNGATTFTSNILRECDQVDLNAGNCDMTGSRILLSTVAADASAVVWNSATDPDGFLDDMTFSKGTNAHHAIEFGTSSPTTITIRGMTSTGFNASNAQNDSTFFVARTSGSVTINVVDGTGNFSYKTAGASVTIVQDPVTTLVTVLDEDQDPLQNARVYLRVTSGAGGYPFEDSVTITQTGGTATVTHTAHGLSSNQWVFIEGANEQEYNGVNQITVTGVNSYTYSIDSGASSPATGTITSTAVIIQGLTDSSGEISDSRTFTANQPVSGWVRMGTSSPYYKTFTLAGTISNTTGASFTAIMQLDE